MNQPLPNTEGVTLDFGKHKGELITRVPLSYLKFMINADTQQSHYARAELARRGDTLPKAEISGHAIDRASLSVRKIWHETRGKQEGLYTWLMRMTLEAKENGKLLPCGKILYNNMKLAIEQGEEFPALKTIMPAGTAK